MSLSIQFFLFSCHFKLRPGAIRYSLELSTALDNQIKLLDAVGLMRNAIALWSSGKGAGLKEKGTE
jgi:hypothetical protein